MGERVHTGNQQVDRIQRVASEGATSALAASSSTVQGVVTKTSAMTIRHTFGKQPQDVFISCNSDFVQMKVINLTRESVIVEFDTAGVTVNLRIV